jgi:hypothetical protein
MANVTSNTIVDFGAGFWKKERKLSGKEIDRLRNQNIPHNSRTIDRTIMLDCMVSHKSTDTRCKSYQHPQSLYWLGMKFVKELINYRGEIRRDNKIKATYHLTWLIENPNCKRVLEWFIPSSLNNKEQEQALLKVIEDGLQQGVEVILYRVLDY